MRREQRERAHAPGVRGAVVAAHEEQRAELLAQAREQRAQAPRAAAAAAALLVARLRPADHDVTMHLLSKFCIIFCRLKSQSNLNDSSLGHHKI